MGPNECPPLVVLRVDDVFEQVQHRQTHFPRLSFFLVCLLVSEFYEIDFWQNSGEPLDMRAVLFRLVPDWTELFHEDKKSEEAKLVRLIHLQSSSSSSSSTSSSTRSTDPRAALDLKSSDICWLETPVSENFTGTAFPTVDDVQQASYPRLKSLISRLAHSLKADVDRGHSQYVSFCFDFFRVSQPQDLDLEAAN